MTMHPTILVDLGGTNTRIATGEAIAVYKNDDHDSFEAVLDAHFAGREHERAGIAIDAAGPPEYGGDHTPGHALRLKLTNRGWVIDREALSAMGFTEVAIYNDSYAAAAGVAALTKTAPHAFKPVIGEGFVGEVPFGVVGLGTGIACSAILLEGEVLGSEGGHMPAALDAETAAAFEASGATVKHPSFERVISGTGLGTLAKVFPTENVSRPADIVPAATAGDPQAIRMLRTFHETLGRYLSTVVACYRATGGVVLMSDFVRQWGGGFDPEAVARTYLEDVPEALRGAPVVFLDHDFVPLMGLKKLTGQV